MWKLLLVPLALTACILDPCDSPLWPDSQDAVRYRVRADTTWVEIDKGCLARPCRIVGAASLDDAIALCAAAHEVPLEELPRRRPL